MALFIVWIFGSYLSCAMSGIDSKLNLLMTSFPIDIKPGIGAMIYHCLICDVEGVGHDWLPSLIRFVTQIYRRTQE